VVGSPTKGILHQPLHHPPQLGRRVAGNHLNITNPGTAERFLLDRIARGGGVGALEVRSALIFDRVPRPAILVDDQQVDQVVNDPSDPRWPLTLR